LGIHNVESSRLHPVKQNFRLIVDVLLIRNRNFKSRMLCIVIAHLGIRALRCGVA